MISQTKNSGFVSLTNHMESRTHISCIFKENLYAQTSPYIPTALK